MVGNQIPAPKPRTISSLAHPSATSGSAQVRQTIEKLVPFRFSMTESSHDRRLNKFNLIRKVDGRQLSARRWQQKRHTQVFQGQKKLVVQGFSQMFAMFLNKATHRYNLCFIPTQSMQHQDLCQAELVLQPVRWSAMSGQQLTPPPVVGGQLCSASKLEKEYLRAQHLVR